VTIERDSWRMIEIIIRRYPMKKQQYEEYRSNTLNATHISGGQSITESKALKLSSVYADRLAKEIQAVEFVYNGLHREEQNVMRERYWRDNRRNIPYDRITGTNYSTRQMKRIIKKIIGQVGRYLGEIE